MCHIVEDSERAKKNKIEVRNYIFRDSICKAYQLAAFPNSPKNKKYKKA